MHAYEEVIEIPIKPGHGELIPYLDEQVQARIAGNLWPVRFVVTKTAADRYRCELGVVQGLDDVARGVDSIFRFRGVPAPRGAQYGRV